MRRESIRSKATSRAAALPPRASLSFRRGFSPPAATPLRALLPPLLPPEPALAALRLRLAGGLARAVLAPAALCLASSSCPSSPTLSPSPSSSLPSKSAAAAFAAAARPCARALRSCAGCRDLDSTSRDLGSTSRDLGSTSRDLGAFARGAPSSACARAGGNAKMWTMNLHEFIKIEFFINYIGYTYLFLKSIC